MIKLIVFSLLGKKFKRPELIFTMIKAYLIFYLLVLPPIIKAQDFEWIQSYQIDYSLNPDMVNYVVSGDQNGNIYWGSMFMYHEHYSIESFGDLVIYKLDESGEINDQFFCYGEGSFVTMTNDTENNLLVLFHLRGDLLLDSSDTLHYTGNSVSSYLVKLSSDFELLWKQPIENYGFSSASYMTTDHNNNIYCGAFIPQGTQILILDPDGNELDHIDQENVGLISSLAIDIEGNIYAAGSCVSPSATFGGINFEPEPDYNNYLVKYSNEYQPQYVKFILDVTCPSPMVACTNPEYVYYSGPLHIGASFDDIAVNGPDWVFDFYVARLNEAGDFLWVNEIQNTTILGDGSIGKMNYLGVDQYNNAYISGFIRGDIDWGNGLISNSTDIGYDLLALKYDPDGDILYEKTAGGIMYDKAVSSYVNPNGDLYLAGYGGDTISLDTISHFQEGYTYPFLTKIGGDEINTGIYITTDEEFVEIFPNPVSDNLTLRLNGKYDESIQAIQVLDINGMILSENKYSELSEIKMETNHLSKGVYFLRIETSKFQTYQQKIIKL